MATEDPTIHATAVKPFWRTPKLEELGNVRDFVREGNASGKSHVGSDGTNTATTAQEMMN